MQNLEQTKFLARITGLSLDEMDGFKFKNCISTELEYKSMLNRIATLATQITDKVYDYINDESNEELKVSYINLKRNIFNNRLKEVEKSNIEILPSDIKKEVYNWIQLCKESSALKESMENVLDEEIKCVREKIRQVASDEEFMKGVQISNIDLYYRLIEYLNYDKDIVRLPKKLRNTEISVINYLNRMIYKPSPFSRFCGLSYGGFNKEGTQIKIDKTDSYSLCLINITYIKTIEYNLLRIPEVKKKAYYAFNTTFEMNNGYIRSLNRGCEGTFNVLKGEAIIKGKENAILKEIYKLFQTEKIVTYDKLYTCIMQVTNEAQENIEKYLKLLENMGVIQSFLVVPNQTYNYLQQMVDATKDINNDVVQTCHKNMEAILSIQNGFGKATHVERDLMLKDLEKYIKDTLQILNIEMDIKSTSMIFEDVEYPNASINIGLDDIKCYKQDLNLVQKFMLLFDDSIIQKIGMRKVFFSHFKEAEEVNLIDLYTYYNSYDKKQLWKEITEDSCYKRIKELRYEFYKYLDGRMEDSKEVLDLDEDWLKKFIDKYPLELKENGRFSFYCQLINESDGKDYIIINKLGPGLYRHYSRYTNLFLSRDLKHEFIQNVSERYCNLQSSEPDTIYTDLNAVLGLNINMHSNILKNEITYPRSCPNMQCNQIELCKIRAYYDEQSKNIKLKYEENNKNIEIVPLGFLFAMIAPKFYSFLTNFSQTNGVEYSFWSKYCAETKKRGFYSCPRLKLNKVILDRRTWNIPKEEFDFRDKVQSFINNINVIHELGMDTELFIKVSSTMDSFQEEYISEDLEAWIKEVQNTKLRKPQYIDFEIYFHQQIMKKMFDKAAKDIIFQEVLPNRQHCLDEKKHQVEVLIEFDD